jgi:hypothetical protein
MSKLRLVVETSRPPRDGHSKTKKLMRCLLDPVRGRFASPWWVLPRKGGRRTLTNRLVALPHKRVHWVTAAQTEPFYRSTDGQTLLFGRPWEQVPRTSWDVIRCALRRHNRVMWGFTCGRYEERCPCGARRDGLGERWFGGHPTRPGPW